MNIVSHRKIKEFCEEHGDAKVALERWFGIAKNATWKNLAEIRADFPATDYVGNKRYVFNIKGNAYRLIALILFNPQYLYIRFVGTHSEYDKLKDCSEA